MRLWPILLSLFLVALPAAAKTRIRADLASPFAYPFDSFPIQWAFSCTFPKDRKLRDEVRDGFSYWDGLTKIELFREVKDCRLVSAVRGILVVPVTGSLELDGEAVEGTAHPYPMIGRQTGGLLALWQEWFDEPYPDTRRSIVRHEVGHLLLFDHNDETPTCLMHPYVNTGKHLYHGHEKQACRSELAEFRRVFGGIVDVP